VEDLAADLLQTCPGTKFQRTWSAILKVVLIGSTPSERNNIESNPPRADVISVCNTIVSSSARRLNCHLLARSGRLFGAAMILLQGINTPLVN
jgi:hypothetical protein